MVGKIYIIRNDINDKVYIGATTQSLHNRFLQHCKKSTLEKNKCVFHSEIQKIGKTHFWIELLESNVPKEKLFEREIFFIKKFNSFYNGYNQTKGGNEKVLNDKIAIDLIIKEYLKGKSATRIANFFEVHPVTVERLLRKNGIVLRRDNAKYKRWNKEEFIKLWNDEKITRNEIADFFGVHNKTIKRFANRLNLKPRHDWSTKKKSNNTICQSELK